jgi:hypothetical protein
MKPKTEDIFDLSKVTVNPNLKSHRNDPFVVRKVEEAKRVLGPYLDRLAADKSK